MNSVRHALTLSLTFMVVLTPIIVACALKFTMHLLVLIDLVLAHLSPTQGFDDEANKLVFALQSLSIRDQRREYRRRVISATLW